MDTFGAYDMASIATSSSVRHILAVAEEFHDILHIWSSFGLINIVYHHANSTTFVFFSKQLYFRAFFLSIFHGKLVSSHDHSVACAASRRRRFEMVVPRTSSKGAPPSSSALEVLWLVWQYLGEPSVGGVVNAIGRYHLLWEPCVHRDFTEDMAG